MISGVKYRKNLWQIFVPSVKILNESGFKFLFGKNLIVITQKIDAA